MGHLTRTETERYTRKADRRRGIDAIMKLEDHKANRISKPILIVWGIKQKTQEVSKPPGELALPRERQSTGLPVFHIGNRTLFHKENFGLWQTMPGKNLAQS